MASGMNGLEVESSSRPPTLFFLRWRKEITDEKSTVKEKAAHHWGRDHLSLLRAGKSVCFAGKRAFAAVFILRE